MKIKNYKLKIKNGFTLIELLVVISIIGILIGISLVALAGARAAGRDTRRKGDLEQIRSALEIYRADCGAYPTSASLNFGAGALTGTCPTVNTYMALIPNDPLTPTGRYYYARITNNTYQLCARVEKGGATGVCGANFCGSLQCNYIVTNP